MRDNRGDWIGWGPGDRGKFVVDYKAFLKRKFRWVRESPLNDDDLYDDTLALIVMEIQDIYEWPVTGISDYAFQVRVGFQKPAPKQKPLILTACGTGVPGWVGPDAEIGRILHGPNNDGPCQWWYVAYNAAPTNMAKNTDECVRETLRILSLPENRNRPFFLVGYSQGGIAMTKFFLQHVRGKELEKFFKGAVMIGNPMREQSVAHPDGVGHLPPAENSGIMEERMTNTPATWIELAHKGDLYADCELDDEGEYKRAICGMIMSFGNIIKGRNSLVAQLLELGANPFGEGMAVAMAVYDAGLFFVRRTGPHVNYNPWAGVDHIKRILGV